jgi:gliding motility-associated-like protein
MPGKKIILFSILTLLLHYGIELIAQSDSLRCNGDLIAMHNAHFFTLLPNREEGAFARIPFGIDVIQDGANYDAFGYRKTDNSIYGVDYTAGPYTRLFKIDPGGNFFILDTLLSTLNYYFGITSGDITPDQRYLVLVRNMYSETGVVIGTGGQEDPTVPNLIYLVDLESPGYDMTVITGETTGQNAGVRIGDLAIDPQTGIGYAFDYFTRRMVTIDPFTGLIDNSSFPQVFFPNESIGAFMFTPFGDLVGHNRWWEGETMIYFNKETGTIDELLFLDSPPSGISDIDGCSCPYTVALEKEARPDTAFTCQSIEVVTRIAYWVETSQSSLHFRDSFPPGFIVQEIIHNPYGGNISGLGASILEIEDFIPLIGVDSLVVRVFIPEGIPAGSYYCQASLKGLDLRAANDGRTIIFSDYPPTLAKGDPTPVSVYNLDDYAPATEFELCAGGEITLTPVPAELAGNFTFHWFDGSAGPTVSVKTPGAYAVTLSDGCGETVLELQVGDASVFLDLGADVETEAGGNITLAAETVSPSPIVRYSWTVADSAWLSCLDCPSPVLHPQLDETVVELTVTNEAGCTASDRLVVRLKRPVFAPNVFSPDGNGINDVFFLQTPHPVRIRALRIFNRWGGLVYQSAEGMTNNAADGWNGKVRNRNAEAGVYVWHAELEYEGGVIHAISGDVVILR